MNRTTSEDSLSKLSKRSSDSNGKGQFLKHEKSGKLSIISEKDDENSSDFSYENILSTKKIGKNGLKNGEQIFCRF